jgi:hypothetical protein
MSPAPKKDSPTTPQPRRRQKAAVRTHTPRPDELSREAFEFIAAIDDYKRRHLRSFLEDDEVLRVVHGLGYRRGRSAEPTDDDVRVYADARERYRRERGRLFPTWSEVYELLLGLGYRREASDSAA